MDNFFLITNNCQSVGIYHLLNIPYETAFIGHYIQDDLQYLKFCKNYNYYVNQIPIFDKATLPFDQIEDIKRDSYPTMYLDDIEINWIHENNQEECLNKYNRRLQRSKTKIPFFIWGDSLLHQFHDDNTRDYIISEFTKIPNSLYVTKDIHFYWQDCKFNDRRWDKAHSNPLKWLWGDLINKKVLDYFFTKNYIKNKYIINLNNDFIKILCFYINPNKIFIKTYILDENLINSNINFNITLYDINNINNESYNFTIYPYNVKQPDYFIIDTKINIIPLENFIEITNIPKTIVQTDETNKYINLSHYYTKEWLKDNNLNYNYIFFNSIERRNFILSNINLLPKNILSAYDKLIPGAFQSDLWRYCYLYIKGGCYIDNKFMLLEKINNIILDNIDLYICMDYEHTNEKSINSVCKSYLNSIIFTKSNNNNFYILIENIINNVLNNYNFFIDSVDKYGCSYILDVTGPTLFFKIFNDKITKNNYKFKHLVNNSGKNFNDFEIIKFNKDNSTSLIAYKTINKPENTNHYSILWNKKFIFFNYCNYLENLIIYSYPYNLKFNKNNNVILIIPENETMIRIIKIKDDITLNIINLTIKNNIQIKIT